MKFEEISNVHNLFEAWNEFKQGKRKKQDVQEFMLHLEEGIFKLSYDLKNRNWRPDPYCAFYVKDPKLRHIHKASVRDRVLYQAVYRKLYGVFDPSFIHDSYSCRDGKGLHKGFERLKDFIVESSGNYGKMSYVLKCDIRKFFDSVDHAILFRLLSRKIQDEDVLQLVKGILGSFSKTSGAGLPLGNVTSQLFANIYLNELDQFVKHSLKIKHYIRYCDDFVIVERDVNKIASYIRKINSFLNQNLNLRLHPNKVTARKCTQGIDFLGYILMPHHALVRTKTRKRILKKISRLSVGSENKDKIQKTLPSYLGILKHAQGGKIKDAIFDRISGAFKEEMEECRALCVHMLSILELSKDFLGNRKR